MSKDKEKQKDADSQKTESSKKKQNNKKEDQRVKDLEAKIAEKDRKVEELETQTSYIMDMLRQVGDPAKLRHIEEQELKKREREGIQERTVNVHTFNGKYVISWDDIPPKLHKVYTNEFNRLVEEIFIPNIKLYDAEEDKEETIDKISYRQFHKTRGFLKADVLEEKKNQDGTRTFKVRVENTDHEFEIHQTFVN